MVSVSWDWQRNQTFGEAVMVTHQSLCFVQFLHPGVEHRPDGKRTKSWNRHNHRRKFLLDRGHAVRGSEALDTEIVFWGEWEPESEVYEDIRQPLPRGPRHIYRPFYAVPDSYDGLQNTDPFVFETFLYGICQQHRVTGPTQLRYLSRGSVILFGSCLEDEFVLDTVFVVRDWIDHGHSSYQSAVKGRVPPGYMDVAINPLYLSGRGAKDGCPTDAGRSYRLYFGATHDEPFDGMFSFFPCLPLESGRRGFARPIITDDRIITRNHKQSFRHNAESTPENVREYWRGVVEQVLGQGLWLGVHARMPEVRTRGR
jgi:hypothetical protein